MLCLVHPWAHVFAPYVILGRTVQKEHLPFAVPNQIHTPTPLIREKIPTSNKDQSLKSNNLS